MLDKYVTPIAHKCVYPLVVMLDSKGVTPNQVSITGFLFGISALPLLWLNYWNIALLCILLNRISDGIDGELARRQGSQSDAGGFLDICLDFVFYASVPLGFALANPEQNAIAAAVLLFSFMGTGSSFLAFAIPAAKHNIARPQFKNKSFYYIDGLAEGTETFIFCVLCCLFPKWFPYFAYGFASICCITTITRVYGGFNTLKKYH